MDDCSFSLESNKLYKNWQLSYFLQSEVRYSLNAETKKKPIKYPFSKSGVYISVAIAILSVILILMLYSFVKDPFMLVWYVIFTIPMTLLIFRLKILLFSVDTPRQAKSDSLGENKGYGKRRLILVFCLLVLAVVLPLLLAALLDPMMWFVSLVSFTSSVSISEIILYWYSH